MVSSLKTKKLLPKEILIKQGDEANEAYLIETGSFRVSVDEHPNQVVRIMMPGELVGEIALLKKIKRTSNVIAQTEARVFVLPQQEFFKLFSEQEKLSKWVNRLTQERLRTTHTDLYATSQVKDYKTWLKDRLGLFPVVKHKNPQDSGAACLAMICRYYGKPINIDCTRLLITANQLEICNEATLSDLTQTADKIGLLTVTALSSHKQLMNSSLPAIVGWKGIHWAVIYRATENKVSIVDPVIGAQKLSKDTFMDNWTSCTVYIKPTERFFRTS